MDKLIEDVRVSICLADDPSQIGTKRSCEGGCLHIPHSGKCPHDARVHAVIKAWQALLEKHVVGVDGDE
jgi:hypothetical protein